MVSQKSGVWSKELEGKELLPAGHHIGGDLSGIGTRAVSSIGEHRNTVLYTGSPVIIDTMEITSGVCCDKLRVIRAY